MFRMETLQNRLCKELLSYGLAMKVFFDAIMWWYNAQLYWGGLMAAAPRNCPALDSWWKVWFFCFFSVFGLQLCVILQFHCWCCVHLTFSMCVYCSCGETISSLLLAVLFWVGPGVVIRLSLHCCLRQMLWSNVESEGSWTWLQCA